MGSVNTLREKNHYCTMRDVVPGYRALFISEAHFTLWVGEAGTSLSGLCIFVNFWQSAQLLFHQNGTESRSRVAICGGVSISDSRFSRNRLRLIASNLLHERESRRIDDSVRVY